jgi:Xaa-Pro aminopeptidase
MARTNATTRRPRATSTNVDSIPTTEYRARRDKVLKALDREGAAAVVFSGEGAAPLLGRWRPDFNFLYLTGIDNEAGATILFDPTAEDPKRRCVLFLRPLNPELDRWDGFRDEISAALKQRHGFDTVMRMNYLPRSLTAAARRNKKLACLHPFAVYPAPATPDLAVYRQLAERIPGVSIVDQTQTLARMRAVKSPAELNLLRKAVAATAAGYQAIYPLIRPGGTEMAIDRALERAYRENGAAGVAYNSIVGAGANATVLHYMDSKAALEEGQLLVIDSAAAYAGYAADVTRTYPVSSTGRFTPDQRDVYETVLRAQLAAIKACRPGAPMSDVDAAARDVIDKAGHGDTFVHGIGHPIGLEVHDITPDGPLAEGMVVTIEPGIYLQDQKLGCRIEDDVLVTRTGPKVLTDMIPKTVKDVEAALAG